MQRLCTKRNYHLLYSSCSEYMYDAFGLASAISGALFPLLGIPPIRGAGAISGHVVTNERTNERTTEKIDTQKLCFASFGCHVDTFHMIQLWMCQIQRSVTNVRVMWWGVFLYNFVTDENLHSLGQFLYCSINRHWWANTRSSSSVCWNMKINAHIMHCALASIYT